MPKRPLDIIASEGGLAAAGAQEARRMRQYVLPLSERGSTAVGEDAEHRSNAVVSPETV